ncbi:MAG: Cysteine desulfurase SufS [Ignavibacteriaceae bacterium]|nr:Cysteine desulfurase SufS [Ignavibacteriaceae bacterium]
MWLLNLINKRTKMTERNPLTVKPLMDIDKIRKDFPVLHQSVHGKPLVYLDNAATTQKPNSVIEAISEYYRLYNSNIHRGVHQLSQKATDEYEAARQKVQRYLNANSTKEVIFLRGTSEAVNLVMNTYGRTNIKAGDEIIISEMEHHSNIVPWQMLAQQTGAVLRVIPMNDKGELLMEEFKNLLNEKTKFVSVVHASNTLGTENPVKEITGLAHEVGAKVMVDGAQAVQHFKVDVQDIGCDFYAFSGHKLYGPTGVGVLWGREELLIAMPPWQGGGDMILSVTFEKTIYNGLPNKFEAGTPNISGAIGLGHAIDYVTALGIDNIHEHERDLYRYMEQKFLEIQGVSLVGSAAKKGSVFSFTIDGVHPHDVGTILDMEGIAIRTGHMCTQPVMKHFGVPALSRASIGLYNNYEDIDCAAEAIKKAAEFFS